MPLLRREVSPLLRSAGAATASQVWRMGVTFATHLLLRRFIPPAEMGIWTWAEPVFILIAQVRDLGVPGHVVRQRERSYGTYLRLQLFWGGGFAAALALAAPLLAYAFAGRDAATVPILRALCVFLFVQGLGSVPLTWCEAEQQIERTIPAELARNLCFAALSLALAFSGYGVWSIIIAHIVAALVYSVVLWIAVRGRISLGGGEPARQLIRASLPLALLSLLELAVLYLDPLILGVHLDAETVGVAGLAIFAVFFISRPIADAVGRAVYPALVAALDRPGRAYQIYHAATVLLAALVVPAAFFFHFNAALVALFLGGERWLGASRYLAVAAFVPLVRPLTMFGREFLLAVHRDRLLILYTATNLLSLGALGLWLTQTDLREIGMAVAAYFPLGTIVLAFGLFDLDRAAFRHLMKRLAEIYLWGAVVFLPLGWLLTDAALRLAFTLVVAALFPLAVCWRFRSELGALAVVDSPRGP